MRYVISIANWAAGLVLFASGLIVVFQSTSVPADVFIRSGSEPVCLSYHKPKFKSWACNDELPAISVDSTPTFFALFLSFGAVAWLVRGPKRLPVPDLLFFSLFVLPLPPMDRLATVMDGAAPVTFLLGSAPFLIALLVILATFIRGHVPFKG